MGTLSMDDFPAFYYAEHFDPDTFAVDESRRGDDGGRTVATAGSAEEAVVAAEREVGAHPERWVDWSVLLDEYSDHLERGRPLGPWLPAERCTWLRQLGHAARFDSAQLRTQHRVDQLGDLLDL